MVKSVIAIMRGIDPLMYLRLESVAKGIKQRPIFVVFRRDKLNNYQWSYICSIYADTEKVENEYIKIGTFTFKGMKFYRYMFGYPFENPKEIMVVLSTNDWSSRQREVIHKCFSQFMQI